MGKFVKGDVVADSTIILYRAGVLAPTRVRETVAKIVQILSA